MPEPTPAAGEIIVERNASALYVRLHNPARANALTPEMLASLARTVSDPDPDVRVVVLTGFGGRHFCSGLDIAGGDAADLARRLRDGEAALRRASSALAECPVPVIAAINGAAFGGGLELAVSCDWRVAADNAMLGMPAARLGVVYAPEGMLRFLECMGPARTRQLFITGRPIDAARALQVGLVDEVVEQDLLQAFIEETVDDIRRAAPGAVTATRSAITTLDAARMPEAMQDVERLRRAAYASDEFAEGMAAVAEKRSPRWSG